MANIHNHKPQQRLQNILESDKISQDNKEDVREFHRDLEDRELGRARRCRYLQSAKQVLEYEENDFRLKDADEEQIRSIDRQVRDSDYYHDDYAPETKKEYRKFIRLYAKWSEYDRTDKELDVPEKASSVKLTVNEDAKDRTDPNELAKPEDIKYLCHHLSLRYSAFLLAHWDLGCRVNEILRTRVKHYSKDSGKAYINVQVKRKKSIDGSKSGTRKCRVKIAAPAIDRWLEESHPDPENPEAYLFCNEKGEDPESKHASYGCIRKKLIDARDEAGLDINPSTHTIRKARITFLKSKMEESHIDKRVGHIPGSRITREYTRLDDSDSNNAYGEAYGEDNPEDNDVSDLLPLECKDCGTTNAGYRDRCYECHGLLEVKEVSDLQDPVQRARELILQKMDEEGVADEVVDKL